MLKALSYWGKTYEGPARQVAPFKPVLHHLIDVAAVALRLQEINQARTAREAKLLGVSEELLVRISAFLAGLHDLGKFAKSFQAKVPDLWPTDALGPLEHLADRGHWRNSAIMLCSQQLKADLCRLFPNLNGDGRSILWASVAGHHGRPPRDTEYACAPWVAMRDSQIGPIALEVGLEALRTLLDLTQPDPIEELVELEQAAAWSWRLAGLTNVADWVGSDLKYFEFRDPRMPLDAYWNWALAQADRAIVAKGLAPSTARSGVGLKTIAPDIGRPRPMQVAADNVPLADGPLLFVIEDTTGSGKTEAALTLASRMIAAGKGEGLYFALPTMATANAMYSRLGPVLRRLFAEGSAPSLVLAHGKAGLSHDFLESVGEPPGSTRDAEDAAVWCAEWIADSRRKAFFTDVGAGTIDQAFLAVLQKKFLTLRQYGLAGRILLVDEAHAFDAYMSKELEALLAMHSALGGSAIVLSATLPEARRRAIAQAFLAGLGVQNAPEPGEQPYPLLTSVACGGIVETPVVFDEELRREVAVERLPEAATAHARALDAAHRGAAVLLIRNSVDEAINSYAALKQAHAETQLFHARFAMCDRQGIEQEALRRFGRDATADERSGRILVATQVVEQSLDLDFDLVISDLAPIDLIIQRAGRLWRHMDRRPAATRAGPGPRILVISPHPDKAVTEKWLEPALGVGAFVYRHPGVMYRSAAVLFSADVIRTPDDFRPMIGRVYGEDDVPGCLERAQLEAEGNQIGAGGLAQSNLVRFEEGYHKVGDLLADQELGTRLGEPTVTLRLARRNGDRLVPWATRVDRAQPEVEGVAGWAMSEVTVRKNWLKNAEPRVELAYAIKCACAQWPEWERMMLVAVVEDDGRVLLGAENDFTYSPAEGLQKHSS